MSKIGKTPIILPSGVTVKVENNKVIIQGAKSKKELVVDQSILKVIVADNKVSLELLQLVHQSLQTLLIDLVKF